MRLSKRIFFLWKIRRWKKFGGGTQEGLWHETVLRDTKFFNERIWQRFSFPRSGKKGIFRKGKFNALRNQYKLYRVDWRPPNSSQNKVTKGSTSTTKLHNGEQKQEDEEQTTHMLPFSTTNCQENNESFNFCKSEKVPHVDRDYLTFKVSTVQIILRWCWHFRDYLAIPQDHRRQ